MFTPRLTAPSSTDRYWLSRDAGGLNECIVIENGSCLPNCVGYAWGRFYETSGVRPKLSRDNAGRWYGNTGDGYDRGQTPRLGAVICWDNPGRAGHVAIVENINSNGTLTTSNSAYSGARFYTRTVSPPNYANSPYKFQGFIYNPAVVGNDIFPVSPTLIPPITRDDAIVREVGYIDSSNKPSINMSKIRLSTINYSSTFSELFNLSLPSAFQTIISDKLGSVQRTIVEYLMSKGLNSAAAIGIIANIKYESNFRTDSLGDYQKGSPTSFGICQWHLGRGAAMKKMAGSNWSTNLTGQLDYLWYELSHKYRFVLSQLLTVPNNHAGARVAADIFVRGFEVPANIDNESRRRQDAASEYWAMIAPQLI